MKKFVSLMMALAIVLSLTACGASSQSSSSSSAAESPSVNITFCNMLAADHPQSVAAMEVLAPEMAEKTNGKFVIDVQVNGALGSDAEAVEATIMGTMYSCGPACATLANFDPNWYILDVPYVFTSKEQARNALDGELGEFLSKSLEQRRLIDENEANYLQTMKDNGCTVTELTDDQKAEFVKATQSVRDDFVNEFGEAGATMLELAAKYAK